MSTTATTAPALTMETILDQGQHRHLRFRRGTQAWELLLFPGGVLVRSDFGDYVLANGAQGLQEFSDSMAFTAGDPVYWSEKLTAGTARVWDESAFRAHLAQVATAVEEGQEVTELLEMADFGSEALARESVAGADITEVHFPEEDLADFYPFSPYFLRALDQARQGLALYAARQS